MAPLSLHPKRKQAAASQNHVQCIPAAVLKHHLFVGPILLLAFEAPVPYSMQILERSADYYRGLL